MSPKNPLDRLLAMSNEELAEGLHLRDIWHDDEGVWAELNGKLLGPFATESEAELAWKDAAGSDGD